MDTYNTSQTLIRQLDSRLNNIVKEGGMALIASAISCMSELKSKFLQTEEQPSICRIFIVYYSLCFEFKFYKNFFLIFRIPHKIEKRNRAK